MAELSLTVTDAPQEDDLAQIGQNLAAFNEDAVGASERRAIAVMYRLGPKLAAGLSGYTAWGWLYVQWLWVDEGFRGQRLASRLLEAAEEEARLRGCRGAYIDTFNPHALHVYQKAGYVLFGALPDFPAGRTRSFLSKSLT